MEAPASGTRWRDLLPIHPAAELLPLMSAEELREMADDIKKNGLHEPVTLQRNEEGDGFVLLDGRNRLDALELLGCDVTGLDLASVDLFADDDINDGTPFEVFEQGFGLGDPVAYVCSKNIVRRHLSSEGKRELIGKLLKLNAEKSDRQVAALARVDNKTVAAVRAEQEAREEIPHVANRTDTKGRRQPARKSVAKSAVMAKPQVVLDGAAAPTTKIKYRRGHSPMEIAPKLSAIAGEPWYSQELEDFVEHRAELTKVERGALIKALRRTIKGLQQIAGKYEGMVVYLSRG